LDTEREGIGMPGATWSIEQLLRCLSSMATSVKVGSGDTRRFCEDAGLDPQRLGYGEPSWQRGVADRIDAATDILRERLLFHASSQGDGHADDIDTASNLDLSLDLDLDNPQEAK
jgi:hypothetical protein